jgi:hypothetical protein
VQPNQPHLLSYLIGNLARQQIGNVGSDVSWMRLNPETSPSCING